MDRRITFCEKCREDVAYTIKAERMSGKLKGETYEYMGEKAICNSCGDEVYVAELSDRNLRALYDVYREKNNIISLEKIKEIPLKYDIGKRPLSLILGWGEMTFSRYYDGDMPSKQYSDILQKVYSEPKFYKRILEENKNNLRSQQAFEKSLRKVERILGEQRRITPKIDLIVQYLLYKCEDITPLALQKALYYNQGFHYAFEGEFIIEKDCEAWLHGPVYREIYNRYSNYRFDPIEKVEDFDVSLLTTAEKIILDSIVKNFCCYSGKTLEAFTHQEGPWLKTREGLSAEAHSNRIIDKELIGSYFVAIKGKYNMLKPSDIENYAKDLFKQIN
ncbi:MAG: type II TA system antitoxin MqsA family protein [Tissierellaceae bacterium]